MTHPADTNYAPGGFGCHEALHMASVLADMVDEQLCEHPAIERNPAWLRLAERAEEALLELYQAIGAEHLSIKPSPAPHDAASPGGAG